MAYSSETATNDQVLRDVDRWKDKIEVRLDNRQVFFLFFGSALCACLLFVLGVIVGKRVESRGRAAAPEVQDPLALLDKLAAAGARQPEAVAEPVAAAVGVGLGTTKKAAPGVKTAPAIRPAMRPATEEPETLLPAAERLARRAAPEVAAKEKAQVRSQPAAAESALASARPSAPSNPAAVASARPSAPSNPAALASARPSAASNPAAVASARPSAASNPAAVASARPSAPSNPAAVAGEPKKARFTLQIGSFPAEAEAQAFAARFGGIGKTYVVKMEVPGKGTLYRVRVGEFDSAKDAAGAKAAFEKQHNSIAFVAPK